MIYILFISEIFVNRLHCIHGGYVVELKNMIKDLSNLGCKNEYGDVAIKLYETGQREELIRYLKKCRCGLVDEMHESQRRVDRIDMLIRQVEKEIY